MKIIDLTHTITEDMPVYPGTEPPRLSNASSIGKDGFKETLLTLFSHTGTHMDPPAHIFENGKTLDRLPVDRFVGKAIVIDCKDIPEGGLIGSERIECLGDAAWENDFLLFNTGWDRYWGKREYFGEYPFLSPEAVTLIGRINPKGIGFDTIGIDPISDESLSIHHALLAKEMIFIENLTNLDKVGNEPFTLFALPLKWEASDGAPVRAIAVL
ncbi:MAG: cyclase family protein [Eggerthellaceae bacterium]